MSRETTSRCFKAATMIAACYFGFAGITPLNATDFTVTNLVSDGAVPAAHIDPNLVNPWGLASSPSSPFWVSDNGSGLSTLYNSSGTPLSLVVTIPPAGASAPTGVVFNGTGGFQITDPSSGRTGTPAFIFDTEGGTISGWAPSVNPTNAIQVRDFSGLGQGAIYKGLAIGSNAGSNFLYAADFGNGLVEQLNTNFNIVRSFTDPSVAPGYSPFGIQTIGNLLYVTYALKSGHDDVAGAGNGYVDVFGLDGTFMQRLVSAGGQVNSPWGLDIAPSSFGEFAGDLLVGNFGDGTISIFNPTDGAFLGKLLGADGNPIDIDGLWALRNGNGGNGGNANTVYFTAGINGENDGLFGAIAPVPEPSTWALMIMGLGATGAAMRRRKSTQTLVQVA